MNPVVANRTSEALKYERLWAHPEYRAVSPGEALAMTFLQQARPRPGAEVIDFGCGTGREALMLALLGRLRVTMIDFAENCLDTEVRAALTTQSHALRFLQADLEQPLPVVAEFGYCVDVMEHIRPAAVERVLGHLLTAARHVFFSISTVEDRCGALIGEPLHLCIRPYAWWLEQFARFETVVHWSQELPDRCLFYVSAWVSGRTVVDSGIPNVEDQQVRANVEANLAAGWPQVIPHPTNELELMILGGGPSLEACAEDIRAKRAAGMKAVTLNGAYQWARIQGLWPVTQIVADARPFNARFTHPADPANLYLIASQCDPSVLEGLPRDRTWLWHMNPTLIQEYLTASYPEGWFCVPGGSTVLLRAIPLLRMLGYTKFHLYGCDSCLLSDAHHAFAQPENDGARVIPVTVTAPAEAGAPNVAAGGRLFSCHPWMISQAQEFMELIRVLGDTFEVAIYGEGLLAYLLETGARLGSEDEQQFDLKEG